MCYGTIINIYIPIHVYNYNKLYHKINIFNGLSYIRVFFACVTNFVKMGKICSIFNFGQSYLAILNVLVENNTGYNFCVFNIVALVKRKN